ncbi:ornithine cyclodeaminase family protein [Aminobacter anthyllidis]|uniref:ornithine cyclodeaminase family protein n=1 Tax=Aminobacter anthyllidis TaxID=1035067 RepID=UPI002458450A|nr:ornithine cyclodeaminase family protein [Aminobacter anthyllidis]MDH4986682.1 ornithine cyclodeaminase family protein [Aminobacter anthyllidis]
MIHVSDEMVEAAVSAADARAVLADAFQQFGQGDAAMQARIRSEAGGVKLSTLGAVIPGQEVLGAKVYSTIKGQFSFVILLFSSVDGRALATFDAGAITRLRTAGCSVIAAQHLARPEASTLAVFGSGPLGRAHAMQLAEVFPLRQVLLVSRSSDPTLAAELEAACGIPSRMALANEAAAEADIVVTASRSATALFPGDLLKPGCFVAAVGSSLPNTRELDDRAMARASLVAVEWRDQSLREAGDLVLADPEALPQDKIVELGELLAGKARGRATDDEITVYKSVGVGLQDIALAGLAYRRIVGG